ncbi:MAG: protoporphyrinogen oxidase HemJ [Gammaproteobacteria bacterium]|nr:protoporphyrinogen oxidase HemJ [Gammaproteobacteria bacterium]MDE2346991.1 protoporphyrinogen oxidase HemJ [Gammaproteobacteria bacterium]
MLWLKALHVTAMVTWFAGLFYLPRLFVYHADTVDEPGMARFQIMERRLFALMTIGGSATVAFGVLMIIADPMYLKMGWLHAKLALVAVLIAYHLVCRKLMLDFVHHRNTRSARWFRVFNEVPSLLLIAIVVLAVVKPF